MPSEIIVVKGQAREGYPYWSLHHVQYPDGTDPLDANLDGSAGAEITYTVFDLGGTDPAGTSVATGTLDKSEAWFDTLQTDDWWDSEDADGYNFRGKIPATAFPNGAGTYKIEYEASTDKADANSVTYDELAWEEFVTVVERYDQT